MNRRSFLSYGAASLSVAAAGRQAWAQNAGEVVVKLGTKAPSGSPWHKLLLEASQKIKELSGGKVNFRIFAAGTMGDEGDMVRKMRIGQLQAAGISTVGLHDITPEPQALDIPLLVKNAEERDKLLEKYSPTLDQYLAKKGFVVLSWSDIGFTYFFSAKPLSNITEARQAKLFCWDGDLVSKDAWIAGGFKNVVVLSSNDILPSLTTGMIDTVLYTPALMLGIQAFTKAPNMVDYPYSTLTGATIINAKTWEQIPPDLRPKIKAIFEDLGKKSTQEARKLDREALNIMSGLKADGSPLSPPDPSKAVLKRVKISDPAAWQGAVDSVRGVIRGRVVPAEAFDAVVQHVKDIRAGK